MKAGLIASAIDRLTIRHRFSLESLAKKGIPSRAEITDAAMGERAECVMLNKGQHIVEAVIALDNILHRMQDHPSTPERRNFQRVAWIQLCQDVGCTLREILVVPDLARGQRPHVCAC